MDTYSLSKLLEKENSNNKKDLELSGFLSHTRLETVCNLHFYYKKP